MRRMMTRMMRMKKGRKKAIDLVVVVDLSEYRHKTISLDRSDNSTHHLDLDQRYLFIGEAQYHYKDLGGQIER